ncbi:MAG: TonB-dependent receptor, partial [Gammaproteobacteria bacterium]
MSFTPRRIVTAIALALAPALAVGQVMEEIVVTAQKREQNLQDVGISISAFSGEQMEKLGYENAQEITAMTPGVSTVQPNGEANYGLAIRGVATSDFTTNVESPVALYLDEVYISQMSGSGFMLYDMERVEILRGPQGTLFGRNATGGLAHFVSRKPSQEFAGYAKATIGDNEQYKLEGAVGGGITDTLSARLSGSWKQADGYIDNRVTGTDLKNQDDQSFRLHVAWDPSDTVSVLLTGRTGEQDIDTGSWQHVTSNIPGQLTPGEVNVVTGYIDDDNDSFAGDYNRDGFNILETDGLTLTVRWDVSEDIALTSITDRSNVRRHYIEDSDGGPVDLFNFFLNTGAEQTSQELRLNGSTDSLQWVAGIYYLKLDINDNNGGITDPFFGGDDTTPEQLGLLNPYTREMESTSAFGQLEYALSDTVTLIGGLRFIKDENDFEYATRLVNFIDPYQTNFDAGDNLNGRVTLARYAGSRNDDEWSGRLQLNYTPADDTLVFASVNRGVRGGGYNAPIFPLTPPLDYVDETMSYDPEHLLAYEIGLKQGLMDGLARLNVSTYYYDYQDYQAFFILGIDTITFNTDMRLTAPVMLMGLV